MALIDEVHIDCDEDGFRLVLTGDFQEAFERYVASGDAHVSLRLSQDAALQLAGQVRNNVAPWADGYDRELAAYQRATPAERRLVLAGPSPTMFVDDLAGVGERLLEGVDLLRKAERENS